MMPRHSIALSGPLQACHPNLLMALMMQTDILLLSKTKSQSAGVLILRLFTDPREDPHCPEQIPPGCSFLKVPVDFKPSLSDVVAAIAALKNSGVGDDGVAATHLQAGGHELAMRVHSIVLDCACRGYVPIMWRGGRLVVIFKKGSARKMTNFRGILVADHLSKVITMLLYRHILPAYHEQIGQSQFGAAKNRGTALASLYVRAFAESSIALGLSWAILFLDLSKAFDLAVRETVMGWMQCAAMQTLVEKIAHLVQLGVPEHLAQDLVEWIERSGGLLAGCDIVADNAKALINSLHDKAWFRLDKDSAYIQTAAGGRQGCFLGPVIFNMVYSIALRRARKKMAALGILVRVVLVDKRPFWASGGSKWEWPNVDAQTATDDELIFEIAFVDDVAALIAASSASLLLKMFPIMVEELCHVLIAPGFRMNWGEGKT